MLTPEKSPLHQLISGWWNQCHPPFRHELLVARIFLYTAATREVEARADPTYDPTTDHRFLWAIQWLDQAAGAIPRICPNTTACAAVFFDAPLLPTRKDLAAGTP